MRLLQIHLDTFGVESVVITDTTGGRVCLECSFYSFSTDTGCTVELVSSDVVLYSIQRLSTDLVMVLLKDVFLILPEASMISVCMIRVVTCSLRHSLELM